MQQVIYLVMGGVGMFDWVEAVYSDPESAHQEMKRLQETSEEAYNTSYTVEEMVVQ